VNHQNFERILRFRDIPGSMCVSVSAHTPLTPTGGLTTGRWAVESGRCQCFFLFFFSKEYVVDTGIPRRVDLHSKRASVVMCTFRLTLLGPIRCGCGKSVTRHHRQLEFHSSLASLMCAYQGTGFGRPSSADWFTPFQAHCSAPPSPHGEEDTSLGPDIHKRTR
jgi:hypothetical protein